MHKQVVIDRLQNNLSWREIANKHKRSVSYVRTCYSRAAYDFITTTHRFIEWLKWAKNK